MKSLDVILYSVHCVVYQYYSTFFKKKLILPNDDRLTNLCLLPNVW